MLIVFFGRKKTSNFKKAKLLLLKIHFQEFLRYT